MTMVCLPSAWISSAMHWQETKHSIAVMVPTATRLSATNKTTTYVPLPACYIFNIFGTLHFHQTFPLGTTSPNCTMTVLLCTTDLQCNTVHSCMCHALYSMALVCQIYLLLIWSFSSLCSVIVLKQCQHG